MDLIKTGKFIANLRIEKKLTQEELAEKLFITDRAISKWERGLSLPDADKMLDLCNILGINVNELLNGEVINMKDNEKKTNELLIELAKQDEEKNKKLLFSMWVLLITLLVFYTSIIVLSCNFLKEGPLLGTIICLSTLFVVIVAFYALKLEVEAGYYECKKCHHRFKPSYVEVLCTMHISTTRFLKCPECHKRSWARKVMSKEEKH